MKNYGRLFDGVLPDAVYPHALFIKRMIEHEKHIVVLLKDEQRELFWDAEGLFNFMEPAVWKGAGKTIKA